jgi:hypothetical protein
MAEQTWVIHWEGPFTLEEARTKKGTNAGYVLYQLSGHHHLYGANVLLYIGQTSKGIKTRLGQHDGWIADEYDEMKVRLGSIAKFKFSSWDSFEKTKKPFPSPGVKIIEKMERLLICACQPAYNVANKNDARGAEEIRIFNAGRSGPIFPEISSWYFLDQ